MPAGRRRIETYATGQANSPMRVKNGTTYFTSRYLTLNALNHTPARKCRQHRVEEKEGNEDQFGPQRHAVSTPGSRRKATKLTAKSTVPLSTALAGTMRRGK